MGAWAPACPPALGEGTHGCGRQPCAGLWVTPRLLCVIQRLGSMGPPPLPTAPSPTLGSPRHNVKPRAFVLQKYSVLYLLCGRKITWPGPQSFLARVRGEAGGGGGCRGLRSPQTTRPARPPSLGALAPCLPHAAPAPEGDAEAGSRRGCSHPWGTRGGGKVQEGTPLPQSGAPAQARGEPWPTPHSPCPVPASGAPMHPLGTEPRGRTRRRHVHS